jgi:hypothetical protein
MNIEKSSIQNAQCTAKNLRPSPHTKDFLLRGGGYGSFRSCYDSGPPPVPCLTPPAPRGGDVKSIGTLKKTQKTTKSRNVEKVATPAAAPPSAGRGTARRGCWCCDIYNESQSEPDASGGVSGTQRRLLLPPARISKKLRRFPEAVRGLPGHFTTPSRGLL